MISEEFVYDEYINDDNDPQKVLIVPDDDYITKDVEVIENEEIISLPIVRTQKTIDYVEHIRFLAVLKGLKNGEFRS